MGLINDKKIFANSGMDTDSAIEGVAPNDTIESYNVRFNGTSDGESGIATDIESSDLITGTRSAGINKGIGSEGFTRTRKGYLFNYNSNGYHQIIEVDYDTEVERVVFTDKTDSGGVSILPLNPQFYVNDIKLINGKFMVFTDNQMQVCYINIETLKSGSLGVLTKDDFSLIKPQPLIVPTVSYANDTGRSLNLLRGKLFQFAYYNTFADYEDSALSSYSRMVVPEEETTPANGTDVSKSNHLIVSVNIGNNRVKSLNIAALIGGETAWYLVKTIDRETILALPDTAVNAYQKIYEAYDPTTNIYSFAFYNDGNYPNLDSLFTDLPYDYVPIKAGAVEVLNGSILALGDLVEGYNRPVVDIDITVSAYDPGIKYTPVDLVNSLKKVRDSNRRPWGQHYRLVTVSYEGIPRLGDKFLIVIRDTRDHANKETYTFTVTVLEQDDLLKSLKALSALIPRSSVYVSGNSGGISFKSIAYYELHAASVDLGNVSVTGASRSISSLKTNSSYQLALAHYDRFGRYFPIVTSDNLIAKTDSYAQTQGLIPSISWAIDGTPPAEAVSYQWLLTKNNTHETTMYMTAKVDTARTTGDYIVLNLNTYMEFNERNTSSVLVYDYVAGDRVTFLRRTNPTTNAIVWFDRIDVEVVEFEILVDETVTPHVTNYLLKVRKSAAINTASISTDNLLVEIYSPKKRTSVVNGKETLNSTLFYEIGTVYPIVNGQYSVKAGMIQHGDSYFKTRELSDATDLNQIDVYPVEDFNFSDFYQSNYNSYGRPRTYNDVRTMDRKIACIRYSDTNIEGSRVNGLTRFFGERIYGEGPGQTSSEHGAINKMVQVGNYLWVIQDNLAGSIPVNISIIEDQVAQQNVAVSDQLLNYIRYSDAGRYGMGGAKESFAQRPDGTLYYIDPYNSLPIRIGRDGVRPIPGNKSKYFKRTLQNAVEQGLKVVGYYDIHNDEYIISISQPGDVVTEFPFSETNWTFLEPYATVAGDITITTAPTKGVVTYNSATGKATYRPNIGTSGSDFFIETFTINGVVTTKKTCINITAGNMTPQPFFFVDIADAELSTLYTSNLVLITGINAYTPISISAGGEYRVNGEGSWTSVAGYVEENDIVEVRQTSSGTELSSSSVTLTVGTVSDTYTVATKDVPGEIDVTVDPFTFTDITNMNISTLYESNVVTISGINQPVPISVVGGEYSINAGAYTSAAGTITNGQSVKVRRTSSGSYSTTVGVTLTVGTESDTFSIGNKVAPSVTVSYTLTKDGNPHVVAVLVPVSNGINLGNIYASGSGSWVINAGDTFQTYFVHPLAFQPWPLGASANMVITDNLSAVLYDSGSVTDLLLESLGSHSFVAVEGKSYHIEASTNSASTLYTPSAFDMRNISTAALGTSLFQMYDNTDNARVFSTVQDLAIQDNNGFNWLSDAGTGRLVIFNNSTQTLNYQVTNTFAGGSLTYNLVIAAGASGAFEGLEKSGWRIILENHTVSVGNDALSQSFQKNDCGASFGTYVTYRVAANTFYAPTIGEANALAMAEIASGGQNYANDNGTCLVSTINAIISVDMYYDAGLDLCAYIDTVGVAESNSIAARDGLNFLLPTDLASSAYILASDNIAQPTLKRRFVFNVGRLIANYPNATLIPEFVFKIRGRSSVGGVKSGQWQREFPDVVAVMTGAPGTYIPTTSPSGGPAPTPWTANVVGGGDGTVGIGVGAVILTFTYNRITNSISVTPA